MPALLIAPHADDETLFASFLALKYKPHIVVVYDEDRESELRDAASVLDCNVTQLPIRKQPSYSMADIDLEYLKDLLRPYGPHYDLVIAPAEEVNGHEEHNVVARAAREVFGDLVMIKYLTYAPRGQRSCNGRQVEVDDLLWIKRKLQALSCYESQIRQHPAWFFDLLDLREWVEDAST